MIAIKNSKNYQNTKKKKERKKKRKWQILFQRTWTFRVRVKFAKPTTGATIDNAKGLKCIVDDLRNSAKSIWRIWSAPSPPEFRARVFDRRGLIISRERPVDPIYSDIREQHSGSLIRAGESTKLRALGHASSTGEKLAINGRCVRCVGRGRTYNAGAYVFPSLSGIAISYALLCATTHEAKYVF